MWATVLVLRAARRAAAGASWIAGGRRARALGLRASDGTALRADRVRRLRSSTRRVRRGRSRARRGRARSRCSSTFVPYYVQHAARARRPLRRRLGPGAAAGRSRGRPVWEDALHFVAPGRHDLNYFTRAGARSAWSRCSSRRAHRMLAVLRDHRRRAGRLLLGRSGERRLGALLRPLHDPGDAGVPHRRARRLSSRSRAGRAVARSSCSCCSSPACWRSSSATTSHHRAPFTGSVSTRSTHAVARRAGGAVLFGSTGTIGRALLVVRLRAPGEHPRPPRRAACLLGQAASTTTRASARSRSCTARSTRATASGSSTRRTERGRAAAARARREAGRGPLLRRALRAGRRRRAR